MTNMDAWRNLSAAEITLLREPDKEQISTVLPLLLKELVLKRWIQVRTGTRPFSATVLLVGGTLCIGALLVNWIVGLAALLVLIFANQKARKKEVNLIYLTPMGEQQADAPINRTFLHEFLSDLRVVIQKKQGNCTWPEFLTHLKSKYKSNKNFHQKTLAQGLLMRRLIIWDDAQQRFQRTENGNLMLTAIDQRLQEGMPLASLVRKKSPEALQLLLTLGGLALLLPNMQGFYSDLLELLPADLDELRERSEHIYSSDGSTSYSEDDDKPDAQEATSSNGNWIDTLDSDLLDGSLDSSLGGDLDSTSGGGDGGDDGGDSGGDGGGCGGGCGGD